MRSIRRCLNWIIQSGLRLLIVRFAGTCLTKNVCVFLCKTDYVTPTCFPSHVTMTNAFAKRVAGQSMLILENHPKSVQIIT